MDAEGFVQVKVHLLRPRDFADFPDYQLSPGEAAQKANEWLEKNGKPVFGYETCSGPGKVGEPYRFYQDKQYKLLNSQPDVTGLIIGIAPFQRCEHPIERVRPTRRMTHDEEGPLNQEFICGACGLKVEPAKFREVT